MKPTYYGTEVRIEIRGLGLDGTRVVQRFDPEANAWIDDATFYEASDSCSTDSKRYALGLQSTLRKTDGPLGLSAWPGLAKRG
jgi:hypothetical protein